MNSDKLANLVETGSDWPDGLEWRGL